MGGFASTNNANVEEMIADFSASCDAFLASMAEAINKQIIEKICIYNGKKTFPILKFDKLKREKLDHLASFVARLVDKGIIDPTITLEKAMLRKINVEYTTNDKKIIEGTETTESNKNSEIKNNSDEMINNNKDVANNKK